MIHLLARLLRRAACHLDGHRPASETEVVTACRTCGEALLSRGLLQERIDAVFADAWRKARGASAAGRGG